VIKIVAACSLLMAGLLLCSDPQTLPAIFLIMPFFLLFIIIFLSCMILARSIGFTGLTKVRTALTVAFIPVLLLILQSLGQLTLRDCLAICIFFGIAYFYTARFNRRMA
jgi:hypothetical protein